MNAEDFRRIALGMKDTVESAHMNHPDFRVRGKIFATLKHDLLSGMVALTPDQQEEFIRESPRTFSPESGAWGRAGCTKVNLASADEDMVGKALTLARQNAVDKLQTKQSDSRKPRPRNKKRDS